MIPCKLTICFAFYPYGGNGGCSSEHPNIRRWFADTALWCSKDPRIGKVVALPDYSDTPIPMLRNRSVIDARAEGADVLVMIDSDQHPDMYVNIDPDAKPFFSSSFDFLYERKLKGMPTVIGAPYCGPPANECVYVFQWGTNESRNPNVDHRIEMYTREQGAVMAGIQPCAALPTGCIMWDMEMFEVTDPKHEFAALLKKYNGDTQIAKRLTNPWFYYEYKDIYQSDKASTEDVTATRDMVLGAYAKLGYNTMFANWDAWAGHWKPKCVGKPVLITSDSVNEKYREAITSGRRLDHKMQDMGIVNAGKQKLVGVPMPKFTTPLNDTIAPENVLS